MLFILSPSTGPAIRPLKEPLAVPHGTEMAVQQRVTA
jgi:hypothetical protein